MSKMIVLVLLLCLSALLFASNAQAAQAAPVTKETLDGQQFEVDFVADPQDKKGKSPGSDTIAFAGGKGDCVRAAKAFGFVPGPCTATNKGKAVEFVFTMISPQHGEIRFTGVINGKSISGERVWSKPNKTPITHRFTSKQP
jgi:hypothetical protein